MNTELSTREIIRTACRQKLVVPGFNIPYLPMMEPVVAALHDCDSFGLIMVANLELHKFEAGSLRAIRDEYEKYRTPRHTRLHLDHVPVIDEDRQLVDYYAVIGEALDLGYQSVMIDGSRLPLAENIAATARMVELARKYDVPVEAELGAVLGHEAGPLPPYEELFTSRKGFTDLDEARQFVVESGADWLSVAVGNIHGAISAAGKQREKPRARIDLEYLRKLREATGIPLVLHGGTGIAADDIHAAVSAGIAKINVATAIRQPYERTLAADGTAAAQHVVYETMCRILRAELRMENSATVMASQEN